MFLSSLVGSEEEEDPEEVEEMAMVVPLTSSQDRSLVSPIQANQSSPHSQDNPSLYLDQVDQVLCVVFERVCLGRLFVLEISVVFICVCLCVCVRYHSDPEHQHPDQHVPRVS